MEVDFQDSHAIVARSFDPADVVDERCKLAFVQGKYAVLNIERGHPGIGPDDADHGDIDLGKNIDRHAQRGTDAHDTDKYQTRDDRVGSFEDEHDPCHRNTLIAQE
jgi:hypothetical protein